MSEKLTNENKRVNRRNFARSLGRLLGTVQYVSERFSPFGATVSQIKERHRANLYWHENVYQLLKEQGMPVVEIEHRQKVLHIDYSKVVLVGFVWGSYEHLHEFSLRQKKPAKQQMFPVFTVPDDKPGTEPRYYVSLDAINKGPGKSWEQIKEYIITEAVE